MLSVAHMNLAPEHRAAAVAFELATSGVGSLPPQMPSGYTAALFDAHAADFDRSLRDDLADRAPELLHGCLVRALGGERALLDICDVGCGTGLLGSSPRAHHAGELLAQPCTKHRGVRPCLQLC